MNENELRIYGASDDLIEIEGYLIGECGASDPPEGSLLALSDGTVLNISYGKGDLGIWQITPLHKGKLFQELKTCDNEDAEIYSDIAIFKPGIKWVRCGDHCRKIK